MLHEPRHLAQRCLGVERQIREIRIGVKVRATLMRQLERIQHILLLTSAERRRMAANHRAAVAAAVAGAGAAAANN